MIRTPNLDLVELSHGFLAASLRGDVAAMTSELGGATPAPDWPDVNAPTALWLRRAAEPAGITWGPRAVILRAEARMIGHAGFHGPPGDPSLEPYAPGGLEIGYTIYPEYRRRGFAVEACRGLMDWARTQGVRGFVLTISPTNVASLAVARKLGCGDKVGSHDDPEDGIEDIFVIPG